MRCITYAFFSRAQVKLTRKSSQINIQKRVRKPISIYKLRYINIVNRKQNKKQVTVCQKRREARAQANFYI